jgi:hypothetical protein
MAKRRSKAKKAGSRKKRMSKSGKMVRKAARKPAVKAARKPAKARKHDPEATVNAFVLMVLIMIALGCGYIYMQHHPASAAIAPPVASAMEKK